MIGNNCIVAGHSIVSEGTVVPDNSIVAGVPGKVVAQRNNYVANKLNAVSYYENGLAYAQGNHRRWSEPDYLDKMMALSQEFEQEAGAQTLD